MSNGLDNFFTLGARRCFAVVAFAALVCYADFGTTDKNNLAQINNMIATIDTLLNHATDGNYPPSFYVRDDYTHTQLADILTLLESYTSHDYTSVLESIESTLSDTGETVTEMSETLVDIHDSFGGITNSINKWGLSISNAIANLQISGVGVVNTNLPFALSQTYIDPDYALDNLDDVFYYLYGYHPEESLLTRITDLYLFFGGASYFSQDVFSRIALLDALVDITSDLDSTYDAYTALTILQNTVGSSLIPPLGEAYYYEYGTRPLLEYFQQSTNDFPIAGAVDTANGSFTDGFVDAVGSLATSFESNVSTNVTPVYTNAIVDVEDSSYKEEFAKFTEENFQDTSSISGVADAVASINNQFSSLIPEFSSSDTYTFDFGTLDIFDVSTDISFEISKPGSLYWSVQSFFFGMLKAIALFIAVHAMYYHISADTTV